MGFTAQSQLVVLLEVWAHDHEVAPAAEGAVATSAPAQVWEKRFQGSEVGHAGSAGHTESVQSTDHAWA